jgi:hypothetical protein
VLAGRTSCAGSPSGSAVLVMPAAVVGATMLARDLVAEREAGEVR